ncbi:putative 3-dehydroshikimate dehydratase [Saccharata proteae CBS 121410]|uniref:3-dehydroshikimate dehydratase n=1 Tax=Saccharata proteae CBS 121410 TaxID=1314787 RepID=A0A9P4HP87_9PEZI|nr:putative 3-dehydroshikimate dehydratase [Saccharata proteae CBS 121410]
MALSLDSLRTIPTCFATCSIGCKPEHTLPKRLEAISAAGFQSIELSMPDVIAFASMHLRKEVGPKDYDDLFSAAKVIKAQTDAKNLKITMLQPFANFEGWPEGSPEREDAFDRARNWIRIMEACGTDMLQVGSSDSPESKIGTDRERFVRDLQELADMLAAKNFRLAYENWCWSTHAPDWKDVWDIVRRVDKPNVGLCLDTFQTAGGEWADPTTTSGLRDDVPSATELGQRFRNSLEELARTIPKEKIYLLQISDAYRPTKPFDKDADADGLRPRGRWSHDFRPLPFDGGYLPVAEVAKAVLQTGFRGPFSYEVFDGGVEGKGRDYELKDFADQAMKAQHQLLQACAT